MQRITRAMCRWQRVSPMLLLMLFVFFVIPARSAGAVTCGPKPGWPVLASTGPVASYTLTAPRAVSDAGWAGAQSVATAPDGGHPRTTDDMATCVPVQVAIHDLGKAADSGVRVGLGVWTPVAGNNAHYDVTVEEFVDCAGSIPGGGQTAGGPTVQHNCSAQGGPHGEPVIQGPGGKNGYWHDIGIHQTADVSVSGGHTTATVLVPADLLDVSAWLRAHSRYWEGDSRFGAGPVSWPQGSGPQYCAADAVLASVYEHGHSQMKCKKKVKNKKKQGYHYEFTPPYRTVHQTAGSFEGEASSGAFKVLVHPVALIQLKAVPYAIAYMPPGNQGKARLLDAVTEGTSYAVGTTQGSSNSGGDVAGTCESTSFGFAESIFGTGFGISSSDLQCQSTTKVSGTTQANSNVSTAYQNQSASSGTEVSDPSYAPGDYAKEAFWFDTYTIALNQPAAVYDDNGTSVTRFLPAKGYPDWGQMPLIQLAACAYGYTIPNVTDACKAGYTPDGQKVDLTAAEAFSLLWLDPFFPGGQSIVPDVASGRFVPLNDFGGAGTITCVAGTTCILQVSNAQGLSATSGFQAGTYTTVTVSDTNKYTDGWSLTLGIKYAGISGGDTFGGSTSNIQGTVNSNGASLGYSASTAVSAAQSITFRVSPSDKTHDIVATTAPPSGSCAAYPNPIAVHPYQDSVFGGILLYDPCAPKPSWWGQKINRVPRLPNAVMAEWEKQFSGEVKRAITANPHLPEYIHSLPARCHPPACLNIRRLPEPARILPAPVGILRPVPEVKRP